MSKKKRRKIPRAEACRLNALAVAADRLVRYRELNGPAIKKRLAVIYENMEITIKLKRRT